MAVPTQTTPDGYLLILAIMLPVVGILLSLVFGRWVERIALVLSALSFGAAAAVFAAVWQSGRPILYVVGGWAPPLGIVLRADGLSAAMMMTTAIIICATGVFAKGEFAEPPRQAEARGPVV
ncbi:MAG TPA: NADH-quinone oxidoreductase subunit J, partial [Hyphomicrobiaceae bacterium]|nr:NADH-quinone oxidoreductase subunit J [Hyphomicrobiaceae bacterium]